MVRLTLNIDEEVFAGSGYELVPTGRHKVTVYEVTEAEVKTGKNAGKPRLKFRFKIADGEPLAGRYLFNDYNAFEGTDKDGKPVPMYDLISTGKAIGLSVEQVKNFDSDEWLGEELFVTVTHEEKKTPESGYKESFDPAEYREKLKGWRSTQSATTSTAATAAVTGVAPAAGKAKAAGAKFKL